VLRRCVAAGLGVWGCGLRVCGLMNEACGLVLGFGVCGSGFVISSIDAVDQSSTGGEG
jgi:hypothetical protein